MPTDDLIRSIPLDAFRPSVPRGHVSFHIEHEDRIILNVRDHQMKAFLTCAQQLFCPLALRDIAEDAGKEGVTANLPACEGKLQGELGSIFSLPH